MTPDFVSVREAAARLGVSESDIRRRISRGELEAERLARPQGTVLRVRMDAPATRQDTSDIVAAAVAPLVAQLARVAELEREVGRLTADASHASARASQLEAELQALRARRWWHALLHR